jgi:hypothetical protein
MPITPYTQPIQFEYKPLNLAAFAVPLAQMQEKFDITQAAVEGSDVDLAHLSLGTDPIKAEALKQTYRDKRDELVKSLAETGNYTQAASKLKELNRLWQNDPERKALEANYVARQNYLKEQKERIDSGKKDAITRDQYYQDIARKDREYKTGQGTYWQHDPNLKEGQYNLYGTKGRLADLSDELSKTILDVASKVHSDSWESSLKAIGMDQDTMDKHFQKTTMEKLPADKVARAVHDWLLTAPNSKFKDWGAEVADFNFADIVDAGKLGEYAPRIVNSGISEINNSIQNRENYLKKVKGDKTKDPVYQSLLQKREEFNNMQQTGEYDVDAVKDLYTRQHLNDLFDTTAAGNIFAYQKSGVEDTWRELEIPKEDDGGGDGTTKGGVPFFMPAEDMKFNTSSVHKNIYDNAAETRKYIKNAANLSGGAVRTLMLGTDKKEREEMGKNVGAMYSRLQVIQKAAVNYAGDFKGFKTALKNAGIDVGNNEALTKVFKDLTSPNSSAMRELDNSLTGGKKYYDNYIIAKNNLNLVTEATRNDKEFKVFAAKVGEMEPFRLTQAFSKGNAPDSEAKKLFNINNYSTEQLAKIGIKKSDYKEGKFTAGNIYTLTLNQVAKLHGYKSYGDAILKGYDFNGLKVNTDFSISDGKLVQNSFFGAAVEGTSQEIANKLLQHTGTKGLQTQEMAHNLINDKQSQAELSQVFGTMDKALAYAGPKTFANMPGFDEQGNPASGSKLDYSKSRVPLITTVKGDSYIQIPYTYDAKEYGGSGQGTLTMPVKTGNQDYVYSVYDRVDKKTKNSDDPLKKQTNATIKVAKFNQMYGNDFNDVVTNYPSYKVSAAKPEVEITTIIIPDQNGRGLPVKLVKRHPGGGGNDPYYSIKMPNKDRGYDYVGKFKTPDALKQAVMEGQ